MARRNGVARISDAARELHLFITNDGQLYRQQFEPILKNLMTKVGRGTYDSTKSLKLWGYLCESGAKKYAKEFGGTWNQMFTVADRKQCAEVLRDDFEEDARLGNYDHLLPKKYQKKGGRKNPTAGVVFHDRNLGASLHQWHSSSGDPIYATGSLIWAGHPVPMDLLEETVSSLEALRRRTTDRGDKRELKDMIDALADAMH